MEYFEEKGFYHGNLFLRNILVTVDRDDCRCATEGNGYTAKVADLTHTRKNRKKIERRRRDVGDFGTVLVSLLGTLSALTWDMLHYEVLGLPSHKLDICLFLYAKTCLLLTFEIEKFR